MKFWKRFKEKRLKRKIGQLYRLLLGIDKAMKSLGWSRQRRRQLWRDFIKSEANRSRVVKIFGDIIDKK